MSAATGGSRDVAGPADLRALAAERAAGDGPLASRALARGLAARLRDAAIAADRLSEFAFQDTRAPAPAPALPDGDEDAVALDFVARAFEAAGDRSNLALLRAVADGPVTTDALTAGSPLPRLALLERVHALVQLGLLERDLARDSIAPTPAGLALLALVDELAADVAEWLRKRRRSP